MMLQEADQLPEFLQCCSLSQSVGLPSAILQNTSLYFCRTPLSIFAEYCSIFLQTTGQYFCRASFSKNTSQCFFEFISQYFFITRLSIFNNSLLQFCRTLLNMFGMKFKINCFFVQLSDCGSRVWDVV